MNSEWLYNVSQWISLLVSAVVIFAAAQFGCRLGTKNPDRHREQVRSHITTIESSLLGLLALLIGFTFSLALSRYELRRDLVVQEANAIGVAMLRTQFLPERVNDNETAGLIV